MRLLEPAHCCLLSYRGQRCIINYSRLQSWALQSYRRSGRGNLRVYSQGAMCNAAITAQGRGLWALYECRLQMLSAKCKLKSISTFCCPIPTCRLDIRQPLFSLRVALISWALSYYLYCIVWRIICKVADGVICGSVCETACT